MIHHRVESATAQPTVPTILIWQAVFRPCFTAPVWNHILAVRSSHGDFVKTSGLRWLSLAVMLPVPIAGRRWALPFWTVLGPSARWSEAQGRRHKALTAWARLAKVPPAQPVAWFCQIWRQRNEYWNLLAGTGLDAADHGDTIAEFVSILLAPGVLARALTEPYLQLRVR
jgi:hypothetical protein